LLAALRAAPELAVIHGNLGALRTRQGRYESALEHFRRAVGLDPRHADSHYNIGAVEQQLGNFAAAHAAYVAALAADPKHERAARSLRELEALMPRR
jgi:tetratricopeptide (TPR) repeat protein